MWLEILLGLNMVSAIILIYWTILRCLEFKRLPKLTDDIPPSTRRVSIIVPTRNEAGKIIQCLDSIVRQRDVETQIIVVDDSSIDETRSIVKQYSREYGVELLELDNLDPRAAGKSWACYYGYRRAVNDLLLFIDADTILLSEDVLARSISTLESQDLDFLSIFPRFDMKSLWVRLIYPLYINTIILFEPFGKVNKESSKRCFLVGAFSLFKKRVYEAVGGHMLVVEEILEDKVLGEVVRAMGYRFKIFDGDDLVMTRMESSIKDLWNMTVRFIAGSKLKLRVIIFLLIFYVIVFLTPLVSLAFFMDINMVVGAIPIYISILLNALELNRNKVSIFFSLGYIIASIMLVSILFYILIRFYKKNLIFRWKEREYIVKI